MEQNKKSYNLIADKWHEYRMKQPLNKCVIDFAARVRPQGKILDIGCGTGWPIAKYLTEQGFLVTGIDISEKMLGIANGLGLSGAEFVLCDFFDFRPAEKYDGIIAFDSFFHFPRDRQAEIYAKASSLMKDGGYLLFTHGNTDGERTGDMFGESFYSSALETKAVHKLLAESGFCIEMSAENYKDGDGQRDLLIMARKFHTIF